MDTEVKSKTVLVTGGSGYVAGWMIVGLLRRGYRVRATLRSLEREASVRSAVGGQVEAGDQLTFSAANLLSDEGWENAVEGCDAVLHVASPMGQGEPEADLVRPAREGTLRVLKAAAKHGVRRFVYTSSTVAAQAPVGSGAKQPRTNEESWTDAEQKGLGEYVRSKTLAEQGAWNFIRQDRSGMTLTTILPGMIPGPVMSPTVSGSLELIYRLLKGKVPALPRIGFAITDAEDLVDLHVKALENPEAANQRFLGVGDFLWMSEIASLLREQFGARAANVTTRKLPDVVLRLAAVFQHEARFMAPMLGKRTEFDTSKAASLLHWQPRPSSAAVVECAESLFKSGIV